MLEIKVGKARVGIAVAHEAGKAHYRADIIAAGQQGLVFLLQIKIIVLDTDNGVHLSPPLPAAAGRLRRRREYGRSRR